MQNVSNDLSESERAVGMLSYLGVCWLIPLITVKHSRFVRFHVNQAVLITLLMAGLLAMRAVALAIFSIIFSALQVIALESALTMLTALLYCYLVALGMYYACNSEMCELPIVGKIQIVK